MQRETTAAGAGFYLLLGASALALGFGIQRYAYAPAALLACVLLLRLVRLARTPVRAWGAAFLAYAAAVLWVADNDYLQAPTGLRIGIGVFIAALSTLPFLAHRLLAPRLPSVICWLPLATTQVLLEMLMASGPYGSWGAMIYSWVALDSLLQWSALGGPATVAFLVCVAAVLIERLWQLGATSAARAPALALLLLVATVVGFGEWRMRSEVPGERVRVAAVALSDADYRALLQGRSMRELAAADAAARARAGTEFAAAHQQLLAQTGDALRQGARLVVWPETVPTLEEQLPALLARLQALAAEYSAEILATPWVVLQSTEFPYGRNTAIGIDADGVRFEFDKGHPVPGLELNIRSGGQMPHAWDTASGAASVAICMDYDFPAYIRASAGTRPGLLLAPADDWPQIRRVHADMHRMRAIENGSSLVRATHNGDSVLVDPFGRVLARARSDRPVTLVGELPRAGIATLHGRHGNWLELSCALALIASMVLALRRGAAAVTA